MLVKAKFKDKKSCSEITDLNVTVEDASSMMIHFWMLLYLDFAQKLVIKCSKPQHHLSRFDSILLIDSFGSDLDLKWIYCF